MNADRMKALKTAYDAIVDFRRRDRVRAINRAIYSGHAVYRDHEITMVGPGLFHVTEQGDEARTILFRGQTAHACTRAIDEVCNETEAG